MLRLFASTSLSTLADRLASDVAAPGGDPFDPVMVCVPTVGMRRWVSQQLSQRLGTRPGHNDGIEANVNLPFPATITSAIRHAIRQTQSPDTNLGPDPWGLHCLVWPVAAVLAGARHTDGSPLAAVAALAPGATVTGQAWRVAHLLDRYVTHRPDMVATWLAGRDVGADGATPLDAAHQWQAELARQVASRIDIPCPALSVTDDLQRVANGEVSVDLPSHFALFGVSALTPHLARALGALGHHHDVSVHLTVASTVWWGLVQQTCGDGASVGGGTSVWCIPRDSLGTQPVDLARHPLLRWAQPTGDSAAMVAVTGLGPTEIDDDTGTNPTTLLGRLQADIRANRQPDGTLHWQTDDHSLRIHQCTGATRQVEVLRDAICHLLAADPTLTEADILICTPNVHRFSGLVRSVFASSSAPTLGVRVTERPAGGDNPVLDAVVRLLDLGDSRCTATDVAEFLTNEAVARRFELTEDDLELLSGIVEDTNIKWGLDGHHRTRWGLPATFGTNSWQAGWEQAVWGTVLAPTDLRHGADTPPTVDLPPGDMAGIARLTRALRHVGDAVRALAAPRPPAQWVDDVRRLMGTMTLPAPDGHWQRTRVDDALGRLLADTAAHPDSPVANDPIDLSSLRRLLTEYWPPDTRSVAFGTGAITMASLQSGRSLPHRVVCLLGLDHHDLGGTPTDGDDLTITAPSFGDHDYATEQRQRLMELLLAAGDAVVITCDGTDPVKNSAIPLPVELAELVDAVSATVANDPDGQQGPELVVRHPRQPFDPSLFRSTAARGPDDTPALPHAPWGFDTAHLAAARILGGATPPEAPGKLGPTQGAHLSDAVAATTASSRTVDLDLLRQFVGDPVKAYYRHTLDVVLPDDQELADDNLKLELTGLDTYSLGESIISELLTRGDVDAGELCAAWVGQQRARGSLPPGQAGEDGAHQLVTEARAMAAIVAAAGRTPDTAATVDVEVNVAQWMLAGTVDTLGQHPGGPTLAVMSAFGDHHLLRVWVDLLALTAADPQGSWQAVVVARPSTNERKKNKPPIARTVDVAGDDADDRRQTSLRTLSGLLDIMELGLHEALPLIPRDAAKLARGRSPWDERHKPKAYVRQAFGDVATHGMPTYPIAGRTTTGWNQHLLDLWEGSTRVDELTVGSSPEPGSVP